VRREHITCSKGGTIPEMSSLLTIRKDLALSIPNSSCRMISLTTTEVGRMVCSSLLLIVLVFIHYTDIEDDVRLLLPTNRVEFDCVFDSNGPVAKRLKKVIPKRKQVGFGGEKADHVDGNRKMARCS